MSMPVAYRIAKRVERSSLGCGLNGMEFRGQEATWYDNYSQVPGALSKSIKLIEKYT